MSIKAIIFDVDGVIFDSERIHVEAWHRVFGKRGITLDGKVYAAGVGVEDGKFLTALQKQGVIPSTLSPDALIAEKLPALLEIAEHGASFLPGMKKFLYALSKRYTLAAASNSYEDFVMRLIEKGGIGDLFACILTRKDAKNPKPAPDIYLLCAARLGVKPKECCVVEDSPVGIKAAKAAGMKCAAVPFTLPPKMLKEADIILRKPSVRRLDDFLNPAKRRCRRG
jgi:HAD superfamily hydrolase (TIGR01509 family)